MMTILLVDGVDPAAAHPVAAAGLAGAVPREAALLCDLAADGGG